MRGLSLASIGDCLFGNNVDRTGSFFALAHLILDLLPFIQIRIPGCLDFRVVNEQVGSPVVSNDKPEPFLTVEPFYCS